MHAAPGVRAAAECVNAHVEWAPLGRLGGSELLRACAFLLGQPGHRMAACAVFRKLSVRKQLKEVPAAALLCVRACPAPHRGCMRRVIPQHARLRESRGIGRPQLTLGIYAAQKEACMSVHKRTGASLEESGSAA